MNCPHCKKQIPAKSAAAALGKLGGLATGPRKARTTEQARKAALARWEKFRKEENE